MNKQVGLQQRIDMAAEDKPKFGDDCNHCGWCCMTEVCVVGKSITKQVYGPCNLLIERDSKYYCSIATTPEVRSIIGAGVGCCAVTQREQIEKLMGCV